jgi:hypothetical protein
MQFVHFQSGLLEESADLRQVANMAGAENRHQQVHCRGRSIGGVPDRFYDKESTVGGHGGSDGAKKGAGVLVIPSIKAARQ